MSFSDGGRSTASGESPTPSDPSPVHGAGAWPGPVEADRGSTGRTWLLAASFVVTMLLLALMIVLPSPYAVEGPGPTENTLGKDGSKDLIQITGAKTYPTTGQLRLVTVSVSGGPGYPANPIQVVDGWFDKSVSVQPVETVFPKGQSQEQTDQINQAEMTNSQEDATVAALTELGYTVPATLTVDAVDPSTNAKGVLRPKDVLTSLNGTKIVTYQDLFNDLDKVDPGANIQLGIVRGGKPMTVTVKTTDVDGEAKIGVAVDPAFHYPVNVKINISDIGGPSAGTMIALGIIDKLTPEDEANGNVIAGTGTIDPFGTVGAIGGIQQKMYGAVRDKATWFLAPASNCNEVVGHIPSGLHVVKISTLHDAREAVTAIGKGDGASLPTCTK